MNIASSIEALNFLIAQPDGGGEATGNPLMSMAPLMIAFVAIMYFLTIRPQQKKDKERKNMLDALSKGDEVVTTGGICGRVVSLKEADVVLEVGKDVTIKFVRSSIAHVINPNEETVS
ncbi:MAG: preprotein translocase subunit YajC [Candidatus Hydrogenedentes bacterium]|nr:preprotein translocase subunit YajC [Candidatus Hydrogenedentota bacterium]